MMRTIELKEDKRKREEKKGKETTPRLFKILT